VFHDGWLYRSTRCGIVEYGRSVDYDEIDGDDHPG
jgi:hypothetical protein